MKVYLIRERKLFYEEILNIDLQDPANDLDVNLCHIYNL